MNPSRKLHLGVILGVGLLFQTACATTDSTDEPAGSPRNWVSQFDQHSGNCRDFSATFANEGEKYAGEAVPAEEAKLAPAVFSMVLPGGVPTESVTLSTNLGSGTLTVTLLGASTRNEEQDLSCAQGWLVTSHSRSGNYAGEGVIEKQFDQTAYFRVGSAGELIVKVVGNAEFNSVYIFNSDVHVKAWYRFRPIQ